MAFDADGNAIAVWRKSDGTLYNIVADRYVSGLGWQGSEIIESISTGHAYYPYIAMDTGGNALVVWHQGDSPHNDICANRYTAGSGWGTAALIETGEAGDADYPRIAMDNNGNAMAVWKQSDGTRYNTLACRYITGSGWQTPEIIETDNSGDVYTPSVSFDDGGNAIAVWTQWIDSEWSICANRFTEATGWGTAELI